MIIQKPVGRDHICAVLFDLDDTLVSSRRYWTRQVVNLLSGYLMRKPWMVPRMVKALRGFRKARESTRGHGPFPCLRTEVLQRAATRTGLPSDFVRETVYPLIYDSEFRGLHDYAFPGVVRLIERLKFEGLKVGVLSDYPVETKLRAARLDNLPWDVTMDCEQVGTLKPSQLAFHEAARRMRVDPERVLYVGDREDTDVQGARQAGLKAAHIDHRSIRRAASLAADLILFRTEDLAEALGLV